MGRPGEFTIEEVRVPSEARQEEQLGTKPKFWFKRDDGAEWLFKRGRSNEDWPERVAAELARSLELPHALVELANCSGEPGIITRSFLQKGDQLVHGNELLFQLNADYPRAGVYHNPEHSADAVAECLKRLAVMPWPDAQFRLPDIFDGYALFVGYLLFDAWIGNSDRHHENWAVVQRGEQRLLAPTYDHGSSMGRNEPEESIARLRRGSDHRATVKSYARKCRSALYNPAKPSKPMLTVDAFQYVCRQHPSAGAYWLYKLRQVSDDFVKDNLMRVPGTRISELKREFAYEIIRFNRERLLEQLEASHD